MRHYIEQSIVPMGLIIFVFLVLLAFPWARMNWGTFKVSTDKSATVMGDAQQQTSNQKASFNLGVMVVNSNKDSAVDEANKKTQEIIDFAKKFGIPAEDIKTQNLSIYQEQGEGPNKNDWRVSNNIEVSIKNADKDKVTKFSEAAAKSSANNVWGPNFTVDYDKSKEVETELINKAVENARKKAEVIAEANGMKVGKLISITEGGAVNGGLGPIMFDKAANGMGGGGGASVEPGSSTISKSVTATFELK